MALADHLHRAFMLNVVQRRIYSLLLFYTMNSPAYHCSPRAKKARGRRAWMASKVFIGVGAGFAGDRTDAAGPVVDALATAQGPRFLMYETLAERTLALAQLDRRRDPKGGYSPALD